MKITLPRGLSFDLDNIPEDFDEQIRKTFHDYTDGTNPAYMFEDKLAFIDRTLEYLHHTADEDSYGTVKSLCLERMEYQINEYDEFPDMEDYRCFEFMETCYLVGRDSHRLYDGNTCFAKDHKDNEKIYKLLIRIMKIVLDYGEEHHPLCEKS